MESIRITLSGLWVALVLTYLYGDVLRIFSGDFKTGEIMGKQVTQGKWLGIGDCKIECVNRSNMS